jgi:hypothetical protein
MQIATTISIGGFVFTSCSFPRYTFALCGCAGWIGWTGFLAIAAVDSNPLVVYFTSATVGFTPIASHAK